MPANAAVDVHKNIHIPGQRLVADEQGTGSHDGRQCGQGRRSRGADMSAPDLEGTERHLGRQFQWPAGTPAGLDASSVSDNKREPRPEHPAARGAASHGDMQMCAMRMEWFRERARRVTGTSDVASLGAPSEMTNVAESSRLTEAVRQASPRAGVERARTSATTTGTFS